MSPGRDGRFHIGDQRGLVLATTLVLLLVVTLVAVTASNVARSNLDAARNLQSRSLVRAAARAAGELALSAGAASPGAPTLDFAVAGDDGTFLWQQDLDGDGAADIDVRFEAPRCVLRAPVRNADLEVLTDPQDASCFLPPGEFSLCADTVWELRGRVRDRDTGASLQLRQGIAVRSARSESATPCRR